jgi:sugar/nucleoside kinase (ribokinase family)
MATEQTTIVSNGAVKADAPNKTLPSTHILAADLLVVDELINLPSASELAQSSASLRDRYARLDALINSLLVKKGGTHGSKISIDSEDFRKLSAATAGLPAKMEPGGATADVLTTIKNLLGDRVNLDFLGIAGPVDISDNLITEDLRRSGIDLNPGTVANAKSAVSFIFTHPDGKRTSITYPGNAAEKLNAAMVTNERVKKSDTTFIPISLWSKFDSSLPETLLQKSIEQDKNIILSIPKQARFDYGGSENIHKRVIPYADVIVADEEELARWYKTDNNIESAMNQLQADMEKRDTERAATGKPLRSKPVTAFIKHKDDSATVLVARSTSTTPTSPPVRYEIPASQEISGKKHSLGVDDAMYAGFLAALTNGLPPQKAGEFAMNVAQTKFLYDTVRIPSPNGADKATQERWQDLRSGLGFSFAGLGSAIGYAKTGVSNEVDQKLPRTTGQKAFDFILYPLIANIGVWALSMFVTYHSNFNQNKENWFVKRSSAFKEQLAKIPGLGKSDSMVRNLNMIIWSFVDGSIMAPVVAAFESKRQDISRWIDSKLGTTPEDKSVYDQEVQRNWKDVLKARATTFGLVLATYFTLNAKIFSGSKREGILNESPPNSGIFKRETVESINGFIFDIPAKIIGGALTGIKSIRKWAKGVSGGQLEKMAEKTGQQVRKATTEDARYQIEGLVNTGLFELVYTSLCTAGLFFIGKKFASNRNEEQISTAKLEAKEPPPASDSDYQTKSFTESIKPKDKSLLAVPKPFSQRVESEIEPVQGRL